MGCFNQACSLSGTPIREDDPVYVVFLKSAFGPHTTIQIEGRHIQMVLQGTYNDYGGFKEILRGDAEDVVSFRKLVKDRKDLDRLHFWVSQEAWDWAQTVPLDSFKEQILSYRDPFEKHEWSRWFYEEVYRVIWAHEKVWRNPLSGYAMCHQIEDIDGDFSAIRSLYEGVTVPRLEKIKAWYDAV